MGYRLEISKLEYSDCGGKLFGYIFTEELHTCKSWKWLKDHLHLDKEDEDYWEYDAQHQVTLFKEDFREFIALYIEDYNRLSPYGNTLSLDDFKDSLSADRVLIEWY